MRRLRRLYPAFIAAVLAAMALTTALWAAEVYGPQNLLRTMRTPFSTQQADHGSGTGELSVLNLHSAGSLALSSLSNRLLAPRLYLPGRLVIGSTAEFIIKGKPGSWVALAMADRNSGAKPLYGHEIHLGPDRKLVSLGQIPAGGVLSLIIDTPIQGDLIGQPLYFEAAVWTRPDFSDMELAVPVPSDSSATKPGERSNGVLVAAEPDHKRGFRFVPDSAVQLQQIPGANAGIETGHP